MRAYGGGACENHQDEAHDDSWYEAVNAERPAENHPDKGCGETVDHRA